MKSHFLFELHPPLSKTNQQDIVILVLSSLGKQDGTREDADTCQMKHWVVLRQPLSCAMLHRDMSALVSLLWLPPEQRNSLMQRSFIVMTVSPFSFRIYNSYSVKIWYGKKEEARVLLYKWIPERFVLLFTESQKSDRREEGGLTNRYSTIL